jgi:hypothetical protein
VNGHELQHWLARSQDGLAQSHVTADVGRGPTVGSTRGPTWVSFESKHTLGRVILGASGRCDLTVTNRADGRQLLDEHCEIATSAELDNALATLVARLQ